jgi:hypothetical protein
MIYPTYKMADYEQRSRSKLIKTVLTIIWLWTKAIMWIILVSLIMWITVLPI